MKTNIKIKEKENKIKIRSIIYNYKLQLKEKVCRIVSEFVLSIKTCTKNEKLYTL